MSVGSDQRTRKTDILLALLALLSLVVLLLPQSWITRHYTLALDERTSDVYSDASIGGASVASKSSSQANAWQCELRPGFSSPFCSYQINLIDDNGQGINLARFATMTVELEYTGDSRSTRLYLRSRNPKYYVIGDLSSTKYNAIELDARELDGTAYSFHLKDFSVADWWITARAIPPHLANTDFGDVLFLEVQTGADASGGVHNYQLKSVSWSGPIISESFLHQALIVVWMTAILIILLLRQFQLKREIARHAKYQRQLKKINKLLSQHKKEVEDLAKTDELTGVANRLGIRELLYDGVTAWQVQEQPFSMIIADIDNFKKINDNYGHDNGDVVLKEVAAVLSGGVRSTDMVARWGGEEFIVICPGTDLPQARIVAENLRSRIENIEIEGLPAVTCSFGVATLVKDDLDHLFKQADDALYRAKRAGKNRVTSARPDEAFDVAL